MKILGICSGATAISMVILEKNGDKLEIVDKKYKIHDGDAKKSIIELLSSIDLTSIESAAFTGRRIRNFVNLSTLTEPEAVEYAIDFTLKDKGKYNALVSAGGETIIVYELDKNNKISHVYSGNKCASGTGEFFIQQLRRMNLSIEEVIDNKNNVDFDNPYGISGRCSVFCKSDCTHALNKGTPVPNVVAGLCKMTAVKITELLAQLKNKNVILTGGIARIEAIVKYIGLEVESLLVPDLPVHFEALGAAIWASKNKTIAFPGLDNLFKPKESSFDFLPMLKKGMNLVHFKDMKKDSAKNGDICALGVDVGSTTTKAVVMRIADDAMLASIYLRTNGNPIKAAKECYEALAKQINVNIKIVGMGVTGSGRQIVGLHGLTEGVINEIVCHATASVYFDPEVDTIFEIGGQDAKYTYITKGVPSDYAMNEACSAGTGSFLEEAANECLDVKVNEIADYAFLGENPPNFNDQCAAFISSDIANAFQEGIEKNDIIAGLVYSICMNYNNRVRGARPVGKKIFMQGGVCYNKAVPVAMANLLEKEIVIPPEPGLMGAYGAALEIKKRLDKGIMKEAEFDLKELAQREIVYGKTFTCMGGTENCDRKCSIITMEINGKKYPFGGACNKYYNLQYNIQTHPEMRDLVAVRNRMIFNEFNGDYSQVSKNHIKIGFNKSFLVNLFYPLYYNFFSSLGFEVVMSDDSIQEGVEKARSAFCYPVQLAHGYFENLLTKKPDYIFMPQVLQIPTDGDCHNNRSCVFVQSEPYYLKEAFRGFCEIPEILSPVIDISMGIEKGKDELVKIAVKLGSSKKAATNAFDKAVGYQNDYFTKAREVGKNALRELEKNPDEIGIVIFGRWYNSLVPEGNMGIPHKFASRGISVIPFDFIPYDNEDLGFLIHWGIGKVILKTARFVSAHPQLFGTYITNFSCGPDSFLVPFFRDEMGSKPSLTLELDSHTVDVGINTRIEAAIDIINYYRKLVKVKVEDDKFVPARCESIKSKLYLIDSKGVKYYIKDPKVTFLFPSMGHYMTSAGVAALVGDGYNAKFVDHPTAVDLKIGKRHSGCKECLPYIVLAGTMMNYIQNQKKDGEKVAYFIVGEPSGCRVEQYKNGFDKIIQKNKIEDVATAKLTHQEGYAGMGVVPLLKVWMGFVAGDVMEQIRSAILVLAINPAEGLNVLEEEWNKLLKNFEGKDNVGLTKRLKLFAKRLSDIKLKAPIEKAPRVLVAGELYVRNEPFSRQYIEDKLAKMGFVSRIIPLMEWLYYVDYMLLGPISDTKLKFMKKLYIFGKTKISKFIERKIKRIFAKSGLYIYEELNVKDILETSEHLVSRNLYGEVGLTIGASLKHILKDVCGVVTLSPFACIQNRVAEAILNTSMTVKGKIESDSKSVFGEDIIELDEDIKLPFLSIESDGNPFPQIIDARLEVFGMQSKRIHDKMMEKKYRQK